MRKPEINGACRSGLCSGARMMLQSGTTDPDFSTARNRPENATGTSGVDLGSRNFNWSLPLVSLPGRAGLDLDLTIYYNSLVWTKQGANTRFGLNRGFPGLNGVDRAPGFELHLPYLQQRYQNQDYGGFAYMLVTPSGGRVEFRRVGTSNIYESADSSYSQLTDNGTAGAALLMRDGTLYTFGWNEITTNQFGQQTVKSRRCTQIKDRNGNFITAAYNTNGGLISITDTLGRVLNFNYDTATNALASITQTRGGVTYTWATFSYDIVWLSVNFVPPDSGNNNNGAGVQALTQVNLPDGSYYTFTYNTYGQVYHITNYAPDGHTLSYVNYNLPLDSSVQQSDCPRFTEKREWAENWNNNQEVVTTYAVASDGSWSQVTLPDNTPTNANDNVVHREYFATTGWQKGLPTRTETFLAGTPATLLKWTTVAWTQDDVNLTYSKNPRITETNVYDAQGNRRRVTIDYGPYAQWGLPYLVREYAADGTTEVRHSFTDYNLSPEYVNRRIIGLVSAKHLSDTLTWQTIIYYSYDAGGSQLTATPTTTIQHDAAYNASFAAGRGNLTSVTRYDVNDINNANNRAVTQMGYDTNGSTTFVRDPLNHQTNLSYTDSFADGINRNTYAYLTTATDANGFTSTTQFNYDHGGETRRQTPLPNSTTNQPGPVVTFTYDSVGRLERTDSLADGAYTRWVYPASQTYLRTVTKVNAANPTEFSSEEHFDGMGRIRMTTSQFPGSVGGNRVSKVEYDVMGRVAKQSNLTETDANWNPAGDDALTGMQWTQQAYDWNGRPTITTNADGTTSDLTYGGCGCAGGNVVTARDERGRRRKVYKDTLGRLVKVEELQWQAQGGGVYATTTYTYNVRDQITSINQQGQLRTFEYDGHGRLWKKTTPEQGTVEHSYNMDDTVAWIKDARGAKTVFAYNNRHLMTTLSYDLSGVLAGQNVAATPRVVYTYDGAGNRLTMTERDASNAVVGSTSYHYDQLSRMDWEERGFGAGLPGPYRLSYAYNLTGELTSVTNPWGAQVGYTYDSGGRLTGVTGANYAGVTAYASNLQHRAFGGLRAMTYGNGKQLSVSYDNRMRLKRWDVPTVMGWDYSYNNFGENTGRVTYARNLYDASLDRSYDYDHVGRLTVARTGPEARTHVGLAQGSTTPGPYSHSYTYDQWGNQTQRSGWGGENPSWTATYNAKNQKLGYSYDLSGNLTSDGPSSYTYNADGQQATVNYSGYTMQQWYDGDRLRVQRRENGVDTYYLRSTVMEGQVVAEIAAGGTWARGYVYMGGSLLAVQQANSVSWVHSEPVAKSKRVTSGTGAVASTVELDPWGSTTARTVNPGVQPRLFTSYLRDGAGSDDAMHRRYDRYDSRFEQPDPSAESYQYTNPQSFNRYSYVANDPVNSIDPTGLSSCFLFYSYTEWVNSRGEVKATTNHRSSIICFGGTFGQEGRRRGTGPVPRPLPDPRDRTRHLNGQQGSALAPAVGDALKRLEERPECAAYISGDSGYDAWDTLDKLDRGGGFKYDDIWGPTAYTRNAGWHSGATIELYNNFFTNDVNGLTRAGDEGFFSRNLTTLEARSMNVLHELRHALTGIKHPENQPLNKDTGTAWNIRIFELCFK